MADNLSKRAKAAAFSKLIIAGETPTEAARQLGYKESSAATMGSRMVHSEIVQKKIADLLKDADLGDLRIVKELGEGLNISRFGKYDKLNIIDRLIKLNGHDKGTTNNSIVNVGKDSFLDFCRAYHQSKAEIDGRV